jgi:oligopeptide/dipeptide ABC transporter ATP-binding protein
LGLTYLFISHDMSVVRHMSDRIAVMYLGRIVEEGNTEELFAQPRHPYTQLLLQTIPNIEAPNRNRSPASGEVPSPLKPPSGCTFHPRCPFAVARCRLCRMAHVWPVIWWKRPQQLPDTGYSGAALVYRCTFEAGNEICGKVL